MIKRRTLLEAGLGLAAGAAANGSAVAATDSTRQLLPLADFARRPMMEQLALSPDGKLIAAIVNDGARSLLVTRTADDGPVSVVLATDNLEFMINWLAWVNPTRLLVSLGFYTVREKGTVGQVEITESRLMAVDADGKNMINLVKPRGVMARGLKWAWHQDNVVDMLPDDHDHILMALPARDDMAEPSVFKVNVYTAERSTYAGMRSEVFDWLTDGQHRVRIGIGHTTQGERTVWACDIDGGNWRLLSKTAAFEAEALNPLGFGLDPQQLYVTAKFEGLDAVFTLDLGKEDAKPVLKLADDRYELSGSLIRDKRGEAVGIRMRVFTGGASFYWDPAFRDLQASLDASLPDQANALFSHDRAGQQFVVRSAGKGRPERFYLARFGDKPSLRLLADSYPELSEQALGKRLSFRMKARDGLPLHGYLTRPAGKLAEPYPLVVLPHGGPQSADTAGFDSWAAFLADRGYLVLQLNFRGSTGYGQAHLEAGLRRWGLEMQEDLEDGVAELVRLGRADPKRVAIIGSSYGGYAALMGVIKTPALYRGAFAVAPVTDLVMLCDDIVGMARKEVVRRQIGHARDDRARLEATSPCLHADRIQVPVVLVHGTVDRQVEYQYSVKMAAALKKAGKPHQFIKLDRGDHPLSHVPHRVQVLQAMERFLEEVMPKA
ncbi:prolyl oligopeptidase family serine peptidase [Pelomonas sp. SE-A7]|uniref:alpha/beta hydrolase family protein n=1 Tax=Pelomonas sp. SE-A7 TaxID=3054953 RepID=UPI00259CB620|nr:prolyl oligopeptidase family serine peptidase [Pelomonas sp. SE-A7]MDM4764917.1 prolyl oligopeptidase family serine peptidase [Pelomonas sp. SE-A7]